MKPTPLFRKVRSIVAFGVVAGSVACLYAVPPAVTATSSSAKSSTTTKTTVTTKQTTKKSAPKNKTSITCGKCNSGATTVCVTAKADPPAVDKSTLHLVNRAGVVNWFSNDGTVFQIVGLDETAFSLKATNADTSGASCHWVATPTSKSSIGHHYKYSVVSSFGKLDPDVVIDNPPIDGGKKKKP